MYMIRGKWYPMFGRCEECGRFVGYENHVRYTYYGNSWDLEPPEESYSCLRCWDRQTPEEKKRHAAVCWGKPVVVRDCVKEVIGYG